jgi:hypothetical protein
MHKLLEYVCDELNELERKADKNGKLSMQEIQYMDTLAHAKKNLLTADAMMEAEDDYSNTGYSYARGRGRNAKRDSMGRYSRESMMDGRDGSYERGMSDRGRSYYSREDAKEELAMELKDLKMNAKDQETSRMIDHWIKQLEQD